MTEVARAGSAVRSWAGTVTVVLACAAVDGLIGLLVGAAIAAWVVFSRRPRVLFVVAAGLFILVPVSMLLRGLPSTSALSPFTAVGSGVANHLAFAAFAALCAGVLLDRSREITKP
jgi:hypothetical protein